MQWGGQKPGAGQQRPATKGAGKARLLQSPRLHLPLAEQTVRCRDQNVQLAGFSDAECTRRAPSRRPAAATAAAPPAVAARRAELPRP